MQSTMDSTPTESSSENDCLVRCCNVLSFSSVWVLPVYYVSANCLSYSHTKTHCIAVQAIPGLGVYIGSMVDEKSDNVSIAS